MVAAGLDPNKNYTQEELQQLELQYQQQQQENPTGAAFDTASLARSMLVSKVSLSQKPTGLQQSSYQQQQQNARNIARGGATTSTQQTTGKMIIQQSSGVKQQFPIRTSNPAVAFSDSTIARQNAAAAQGQSDKATQETLEAILTNKKGLKQGGASNGSQTSRGAADGSSSRYNENAISMSEYYKPSGQAPLNHGGNSNQAANKRNNSLIQQSRHVTAAATLYRTHALQNTNENKEKTVFAQTAAQTLASKPAAASVASVIPALETLTTSPSSNSDASDEPSLAPSSSSENIHEEDQPPELPREPSSGFTDVDDNILASGLQTISLKEDAPVEPVVAAAPLAEASSSSSSSSSIPVESTDSLPPPDFTEIKMLDFDSYSAAYPRRNHAAAVLAPHLFLPKEQEHIRHHLLQRERDLAVHPNYISLQPELNYRMREILFDWLGGVAARFRFKPEVMMLCVNVLDRFLSKRECSRDKFQLVGISCLIVAAKYEEILPPSLEDFLAITDHAFQRKQVLHMEGVILESIGFELTIPYISSFSGPLLLLLPIPEQNGSSKNFESELKNMTTYIILAALQHYQFLHYPPSLMAAASVALAYYQYRDEMYPNLSEKECEEFYWDQTLQDASGGYTTENMIDVLIDLEEILNLMSGMFPPPSNGATVYNSVTKRFQRSQHDAVALRKIKFPQALIKQHHK